MPRGEPKYTGRIPRRDRAPSALWFFTWPAWLMSTRVPVRALVEPALSAGTFLILGFRLVNCLVTVLL